MMYPTPVIWNVSERGLNHAIYWASKKFSYSIDRPGMNRRGISESLDDKIMGDVATIAVLSYLHSLGVHGVAYDKIRIDDFKRSDPGWDIAIGSNILEWAKNTNDPANPHQFTKISIKSSRLPRTDTLCSAIANRDFKIFKFRNSMRADMTTDLEVQVYYDYNTTQLGNLEIIQADIDAIKLSPSYDENLTRVIFEKLDIKTRWGTCNLVAYNDKDSMCDYSEKIAPNNTWDSFGKQMWIAPLRFGKSLNKLNNT